MEPSKGRIIEGKMAGLYDLEATLGRGHFAVVKLARHVFTGEKVAVKVIDKLKLDEISRAHLFQEVRCMKLVQHPNVVRLYEVIDTQTKLYLVLELADGGDLYDYIMRHESGLSEPLARHYFGQIVRAISYCHRLHVVHRDLKPENVVFFERTQVVKLTDFGFSNKFCPGQKLETSCGSLAYSAPEILLGDSYDAPAVDVWSLGVILYMLVCGQAPFQEANDSETLTMIMDCKYSVPPHISPQCKELIGKMLVREPEKRASLGDIASHPWLASEPITTDLPLVSSQRVSDQDKNTIIQKMVNGNICTKEQILESLEKNEYNYLTATYYLLAERMLRALEPKTTPRLSGRNAPTVQVESCKENDSGTPSKINQNFLTMGRQADLVQRSRKCSIVAEDEEEESSSSREGSSLNRRGSRSEGKLHLAVQEIHRQAMQINSITEASTAPGPLHPSTGGASSGGSRSGSASSLHHVTPVRGVKSLPSPIGSTASSPQLGPISSINRYERRNKLRKASTASCSSSDASDEDSESRNKRKGSNKSLERGGSGGQDPGASSGGGGTTGGQGNSAPPPSGNTDSNSNPSLDQNSTGRRQCLSGRRRRGCETRLRESQSLNRITEVQESESAAGGTAGSAANHNPPPGATNHHGVTRLSSDSASIHSVSTCQGDNINQGNVKRSTLLGRYLSLQKKFCLPLIGRGRLYKVPKDINQNLGPVSNPHGEKTYYHVAFEKTKETKKVE